MSGAVARACLEATEPFGVLSGLMPGGPDMVHRRAKTIRSEVGLD